MNAITHVSAPEQVFALHDGDIDITVTQIITAYDVSLHMAIDEDMGKLTTEMLVMPLELALLAARALLVSVGELRA